MQMYLLSYQISGEQGVPVFFKVNQSVVALNYYELKISDNQFLPDGETVHLISVMEKGRSKKLHDIHRWELGKPNAYLIVCSEKLKQRLQQLSLPQHRWYNAEVRHQRKKYAYYILHFKYNFLTDVNFQQSVFGRTEIFETSPVSFIYSTSQIYNIDSYQREDNKLYGTMHWLYPQKLVFREGFNLDVWGLRGQIILSERARNAITAAGITGVAMPPLQETEQFADMEIGEGI